MRVFADAMDMDGMDAMTPEQMEAMERMLLLLGSSVDGYRAVINLEDLAAALREPASMLLTGQRTIGHFFFQGGRINDRDLSPEKQLCFQEFYQWFD